MKQVLVAACVTLLVGMTVAAQPRQQAPLTIVDLGVLPGAEFSEARSINNHGQVVGKSGVESGPVRAFLWENGVMTDLGTLGGPSSDAWDINDLGQVVGASQTASGAFHAFLWQNGRMIDLHPGGAAASRALQINSEGQVVGHVGVQPVLWQNGEVIELELDWAVAINDRGDVAGYVLDESNEPRAAIWRRGRIIELQSFRGAERAQPSDINRTGQIAGTATLEEGRVRAFVSRGRRLVDLGRCTKAASASVSASTGSARSSAKARPPRRLLRVMPWSGHTREGFSISARCRTKA